MKNKYVLKSSINNAHRIICKDNSEVFLEKIDSIFAKLLYQNNGESYESQGILSHVKGLNLISKKSLFMNYSDDEAIKKYNQKASFELDSKLDSNDTQKLNELVRNAQKSKADIMFKALHNPQGKVDVAPNNINSEFFTHISDEKGEYAGFGARDNELNFSGIKNVLSGDSKDLIESNIADSKETLQDSKPQETKENILALVNPYKLREYSFVVPEYISIILNVTPKSKIYVYCPLDLNSPLENSIVNYLFPIIFNTETKLAAQIPLSIMDYPDFNPQSLRKYL
ncbi:hypothetical protein DCO58_00430 [Helicobacter saguini]|uniref:Uncharacterized protein n=1 Tax=Helicobacter saguini TaxID=1548018 RepID=A0A347W181_9HELI|nr:flagellar assembly protein FliW [Helicobacter saguini]MWV63141.1 hypothetical protein [Helicobacter saguini]MWV66189.1 hypothetical protein [Helicobacter saguini]MWV68538.1 hypothetical protein [Helicobacter saguini]MWV71907.1 hypothetical protein [Helicobacter saguini]TLD95921.1 hypothetical protein LS64_000725 [Helicobacter saguini]